MTYNIGKKPSELTMCLSDLQVLEEKCNRDIQSKNSNRAHSYLKEYNRLLCIIKELRPEVASDFELMKTTWLENVDSNADTNIVIKTRIDYQTSRLLRRINDYDETSPSILAYKILKGMGLHAEVIKVSEKLFCDGHYSSAIFEAFKTVEIAVKNKSGLNLSGRDLMAQAFNIPNPLIKIKALATQTDKNEQEGFKFLFMGAMEGIRNPEAHEKDAQPTPYESLEYLALASLLLKKIKY